MRLWLVGLHNNNNYGKKLKKYNGLQFQQYQQMNRRLSLQTIGHQKGHDIWHRKSMSWLETDIKSSWINPVNGILNVPYDKVHIKRQKKK